MRIVLSILMLLAALTATSAPATRMLHVHLSTAAVTTTAVVLASTPPITGIAARIRASFVSATQGWIAADSRILVTSDGGRTWAAQYEATADQNGAVYVDAVDFVSARQGWAVTSTGFLVTSNGGKTWHLINGDIGALPMDINFNDADRGWRLALGGKAPTLARTTDGGRTWMPVADPCTRRDSPFLLDSMSFTTPTTGWIICWVDSTGHGKVLFKTIDGARH